MDKLKNAVIRFLSDHPIITGIVVFAAVFSLTSFLSYREYQLRIAQERELVSAKLIEVDNSLGFILNNGTSAARTLAFLAKTIDPVENFDSIAPLILANNPGVDVLQYLDSGTIVAVYPLAGNESVIGYDILANPEIRPEVMEAINRKQLFYSGPIPLRQGGTGVVGRVPVFNADGSLKGISALIIYLETILSVFKESGLSEQGYGFQLSKINPVSGQLETYVPDNPIPDRSSVNIRSLEIPQGNWTLSVWLKDSKAWSDTLPGIWLRVITSILLGIFAWTFAGLPRLLRKLVEEKSRQLIQANERFELATKATSDIIWDWDLINHKTLRSEQLYDLLGYKPSSENENNGFWETIIHPEDFPKVDVNLHKFLKSGDTFWKQEFRLKKSNGEFCYVLDKGFAIRDEDGKVVRMIGATQDITAQKQAELDLLEANQQLANANKELQAFASVASHDMKEPLRMISSFMMLLRSKYSAQLDEKANQYIHFAVDGATRLTQLINDLLEFSRVGFDPKLIEELSVDEIIKEVISIKSTLIKEAKAEIKVGPMPVIRTIRVPIRIVFQNLLGNALKYIHPGQEVKISIEAEELPDFWKFSIKDNGIGIDPQYLEQIFELLKRLHTKTIYPGTGMGLTTCRKIVTQFGGQIWAESTPGQGSTFHFTLKKL